MKFYTALCFLIFSTLTFGQQDQKVNGKWAYYSEEFYTTLASKKNFDRSFFNRLFMESHSSVPGKFDTIGTQCDKGATCYRHTVVGYDRARTIMFGELDMQKDAQGMFVIDVYCGRKIYYQNVSDISSMGSNVNIEHTWPQSKFNGNYPKEMQKSDMHHLYPTDSQANATRGNSPFGLVAAFSDRSGSGCSAKFGLVDNQDVYTPPANHRGNVARALFYFSMHYNLGIDKTQEMILREWHKVDPVDAAEIRRHEIIAKYQKVRNPFVDHPETVEKVSDF